MARAREAAQEQKRAKRMQKAGECLAFRLSEAIEKKGGQLTGMSFKLRMYECLLTVKADFDDKPLVCFAGSETPEGALLKAEREITAERARWKADRWNQ